MNKAKSQRVHALKRIAERYGIWPTGAEMDQAVKDIKDRTKGKFLFKESNRLAHWSVKLCGIDVRVVYDKQRKTIVTALPQELEVAE